MAKGTQGRRGIASRQCRRTPYPLTSSHTDLNTFQKNRSKTFKQDWVDAMCSVCIECPHNAVLLLCSSHEKGCRPYMCGTSFRHSNCLDQYKKAYSKSASLDTNNPFQAIGRPPEDPKAMCPLCRGEVKGWTVVEPAREHLDAKKRSCMQENCSFIGTYQELRKHVRAEHPLVKPREVDPALEQRWRGMVREREREDVMSTIRSSMPGAVFFGDYVIDENNHYGTDSDDEDDDMERDDENEAGINRNLMPMFLFLQAFGSAGNVGPTPRWYSDRDEGNDEGDGDEGDGNYGTSLAGRLGRQGRVLLGRSGRRRRRREAGSARGDRL